MTCARLPSSPAPAVATPLEDENLLPEILLRLPPLPSSLPRASLVCSRWRRLVSDRGFIRRFRTHHRRNPPPMLGFFEGATRSLPRNRRTLDAFNSYSFNLPLRAHNSPRFNPILDPPDRVPVRRFSLHSHRGANPMILGCRDGLVLMVHAAHHDDVEVLVWDPVTGVEHSFAVPPVLYDRDGTDVLNGAVRRVAGIEDEDPPFRFQVVVVGIIRKNKRLFTCVHSSETGEWGDPVYASVDSVNGPNMVSMRVSSTLVGNSFYWTLDGITAGILKFDLDRKNLVVIPVQLNAHSNGSRSFRVIPAQSGELRILELFDFSIHLWKTKIESGDGVVSWVLTKTIELDRLLSLDKDKMRPMMVGYCEDNNVVFLWTVLGVYMLQIDSLKFSKPPMQSFYSLVHPFTSVYIPGMGIGGGHDRAQLFRGA